MPITSLIRTLANLPVEFVTRIRRLSRYGGSPHIPAELAKGTDDYLRMEKILARMRYIGHRMIFLPLQETYTDETEEMRQAYTTMVRDPFVKAALFTKMLAVCQLDIQVQPASDAPLDKDAAEFVKYCLTHRCDGGSSTIARNTLYGALIAGWNICEPKLDLETRGRWAGKLVLTHYKDRDPTLIQLLGDSFRNINAVRDLRTMDEWHPSDFVIFRYMPLYQQIFGTSDLRAAYRAFWLKDASWKLRAIGLERYTLPMLMGTYTHDDQREDLEASLAVARGQSWLTTPDGVKIQALELAAKGTSDFQAAISDLNEEIVVGITGATLQMLQGQVSDARGSSDVHRSTAELLQWQLASDLASTLNSQLVPLLIDPNFDASVGYPRVTFGGVNDATMSASVQVDRFFWDIGMELSKDELRERYGRQKPLDDDDRLVNPQMAQQPGGMPGIGGFGGLGGLGGMPAALPGSGPGAPGGALPAPSQQAPPDQAAAAPGEADLSQAQGQPQESPPQAQQMAEAPALEVPPAGPGHLRPALIARDLRDLATHSKAIADLQAAYYGGRLPRAAAVANANLVYGLAPEQAEQLFPPHTPTPAPTPAAGQIPGVVEGTGADAVGTVQPNLPDAAVADSGREPAERQMAEPDAGTSITETVDNGANTQAPAAPLNLPADVPDVQQERDFDCGPAATAAVDQKQRGESGMTIADYVQALGTTPDGGTPPPEIGRFFEFVGCPVRAEEMDLERLDLFTQHGWPVICPIQRQQPGGYMGGHYVTVRGVSPDHATVYLQDPADGRVTMPADEFLRRWHDQDAHGSLYLRYGIAVGRARPKRAPAAGQPADEDMADQPEQKPHKFATTHIELPPDLAEHVHAAAAAIPDEDLAEDGREDHPHITVKYGLHTDDPESLRQLVAGFGPVQAKLGPVTLFQATAEHPYDVVKVSIVSPDLKRLNRLIADHVEHTDTHPQYNPHLTLAYVKPGLGQKYVGRHPQLSGLNLAANTITFSDRLRNEHQLPLTEPADEDMADQGVNIFTTAAKPIDPEKALQGMAQAVRAEDEQRRPFDPPPAAGATAASTVRNDVADAIREPAADYAEPPPGGPANGPPQAKETPTPPDHPDVAGTHQDADTAQSLLDSARRDGAAVIAEVTRAAIHRLLSSGHAAGHTTAAVVATGLYTPDELQRIAEALAKANATAELLGRARAHLAAARVQQSVAQFNESDFSDDPALLHRFADYSSGKPGLWPLSPVEAVRHFATLIPGLGQSLGDGLAFADQVNRAAFTLAVTTEQQVLQKVKQAILNRLATGKWTSPTGEPPAAEIDSILADAGVAPANPSYSDMVFRTNAMQSYTEGTTRAMQDPDVADVFPAWEYLGIHDGRQRPGHEIHFGKLYPNAVTFAEVRDWSKGSFDGFQCRCCPRPVSKYELKRRVAAGQRVESWPPTMLVRPV